MNRRDQDSSSGFSLIVIVIVVDRYALVHVKSQWHGSSTILSDRFRTVKVVVVCWISIRRCGVR